MKLWLFYLLKPSINTFKCEEYKHLFILIFFYMMNSTRISLFFHRIKELFESYLEFLFMSTMSTLVCHCIGRHSWFMFIKLLIAVEATNKQRRKSAHSAALVLSGTVYVFNWSLSSSSSQKGAQKTFGKMHRSACAQHSALHYGQNWYFVSKIVLTTGTVWGNLRGNCR